MRATTTTKDFLKLIELIKLMEANRKIKLNKLKKEAENESKNQKKERV